MALFAISPVGLADDLSEAAVTGRENDRINNEYATKRFKA